MPVSGSWQAVGVPRWQWNATWQLRRAQRQAMLGPTVPVRMKVGRHTKATRSTCPTSSTCMSVVLNSAKSAAPDELADDVSEPPAPPPMAPPAAGPAVMLSQLARSATNCPDTTALRK